ncbi:hypothetical protein BDP27DRAFT_1438459 [Rhodocollybia butyracea]|uniref:Uncharacterized protein n=1 Tax=Rhodocollybia butyracea TaxID=206335 RepID=A0A9P5P4J7_9AGAR|nr:hypothetical protein BDP27DRAFT_1438459 [Rhodocollybia butyracea]
MVSLILRKLVFVIAPLLVAVQALPASFPPTTGTYRIQNAATGLYLDLDGDNPNYADTLHVHCSGENLWPHWTMKIITFPLDEPLAANQEWILESIGPVGVPKFGLRSNLGSQGNPLILSAVNPNGGPFVLAANPTTGDQLNVTAVPGGFNICNVPFGNCYTGPSAASVQVTTQAFVAGSEAQIWIFESV